MFKKNKTKKPTHIDTLIGQYTHIKGDISFSGGLRVDGSITGNVHALKDDENVLLILSEHGRIEGDVSVSHLIIDGTVNGNIYASAHIELANKAHINGDLYYNILEMAMGSEVNGRLIHNKADTKEKENFLNIDHEVFEVKENISDENNNNRNKILD